MNHYYVYGYFEPNKEEPFYIGKGYGNRIAAHLELGILSKGKSHFYKKLRYLLRNGIAPDIKIIKNGLTEQEAFDLEIILIAKYGRLDLNTGCLTNHTTGGDGASGHIVSEETKKKIRLARVKQHISDETKEKMSIANLHHPPEVNLKKRIGAIRHRGRKICAIDPLTNKIVYTFDCVFDVRKSGFSPRNINTALRGRRNRYYGYIWKYLEEEETNKRIKEFLEFKMPEKA